MQKHGGGEGRLLEIDVLRGEGHDLLCDQGIYSGLLRCAVEGKLDALIGGPPCRTRSVLRHYDIPGQPDCPRPIRAWGGEEFGIKDATEEEKKKLQEDDLVAWRMMFLFHGGVICEEGKRHPRGRFSSLWSSLHHRRHTSLKWCPGGTLGTGRS